MTLAFLKASRRLWGRRLRYRRARLKLAQASHDTGRVRKWKRLVTQAEHKVNRRDSQLRSRHVLSWEAFQHVQPGLTAGHAQTLARVFGPAFHRYGITTHVRAAAAVAQMAHESAGFTTTVEFASGAEYEGRRDLGNTHPGDGPRFKGRGYIQITGRSNFAAASKAFGVDFLSHPDKLASPRYAALVSCWWWHAHGCNELADSGDFVALTRRINGGTTGLQSREVYWARAKQVAAGLTP